MYYAIQPHKKACTLCEGQEHRETRHDHMAMHATTTADVYLLTCNVCHRFWIQEPGKPFREASFS